MALAIKESSENNISDFDRFGSLPPRIVTDIGRVLIQKRPFLLRLNIYLPIDGGIQFDTIQISRDNSLLPITSRKFTLKAGQLLSDHLPDPNPADVIDGANRILSFPHSI